MTNSASSSPGSGAQGIFSAKRTAPTDDLKIDVRGVGPITFPVPAPLAEALCRISRPARYGQGEQTLGMNGASTPALAAEVDGDEVCAATPSKDLTPHTSEYEGYMGNYGNTMDRWYHLEQRLARPPRAPHDWSIVPPHEDHCELCATLATFLAEAGRRTHEWPIAKDKRSHIHQVIDRAELPVRHLTRRTGRPYTLVLTKTDALFTGEAAARRRDEADLRALAGP